MHLNRYYILLSIVLGCLISVKSQTVSPTVPDFTSLTAEWVRATYGTADAPYAHTGVHPDRHALVTSPGTDRYTNGNLPLLPENVSKVVRLGEARSGQSESLSYRFIVDAERPLLKVRFAAVFNEYIGTPEENRSLFTIRILDASGNLLHSYAEYKLRLGFMGYIFYKSQHDNPPYWYEWTDLTLDLTPGCGQEVEVQFVKSPGKKPRRDSWAYAYFVADCSPAKMQMHDCSGRDFKLSAPEGYIRYNWSDGSEGITQSWQTGDSDMRLSCTATSVNGYKTTLIASINLHGNVPESSRIIRDTILQGFPYTQNFFNLPAFKNPGGYTYHQTFCDPGHCSSEIIYSLSLWVSQCYYPIEAQICEGEDYVANGFKWLKPEAGIYYDTLRLHSATGQDSIVCLQLSVSASSIRPDQISGNTAPCSGNRETYTIPFTAFGGDFWQWEVPPGVDIVGGSKNQQLTVVFTDEAQAGDFVLHYATGCINGDVSLRVEPHPSYQQFQIDSICLGEEYHRNNFHLPAQKKEGSGLYYQFHTTAAGCDSVLSLGLTVLPTPEIKMIRSDSVICEGDEVRLRAQIINHREEEETGPFVAVGDVYCSDGSILRPAAYATSGKTVEGVVFWVDASGRHGWILHKDIQCKDCAFVTGESIPLPEGLGTDPDGWVVTDTAGYHNTRLFWESGRINDYPAAQSVAFNKGWYLPASKQLLILAGNMFWQCHSLR